MKNNLESICQPVFSCIADYWQLAEMGGGSDMEAFRKDILGCLAEAEERSRQNPELEAQFRQVQMPVVFFIDYMVKEGKFTFRDEWRELARNFNELSGDEKFFDLLQQTLSSPSGENAAELFYIMLGMGFKGVYGDRPDYIKQCMDFCAQKALKGGLPDFSREPILPRPAGKNSVRNPFARRFTVKFALAVSAVFLIICFIINLISFSGRSASYRAILSRTSADAVPTETVFNGGR
jgi:type IV/VI secretion system ImpK/VasF family protein